MYTGKSFNKLADKLRNIISLNGYFIFKDTVATGISYDGIAIILTYENVIVGKLTQNSINDNDEIYLEELYRDVISALTK